jgi:hypothetical protein
LATQGLEEASVVAPQEVEVSLRQLSDVVQEISAGERERKQQQKGEVQMCQRTRFLRMV